MIFYFFIRYVGTLLALSMLSAILALFAPLFADGALPEVMIQGLFWSSLATPVIIHREFKRRNLWPLYDNLRLSKRALLGSLTAAAVTISLLLHIWL